VPSGVDFDDAAHSASAALYAAANGRVNLGHGDGIGEKSVAFVARAWHRALRGMKDNGNAGGPGIAAESAADFEAVQVGEVHVEQDCIDGEIPRGFDAFAACKRVRGFKACQLEQLCKTLCMSLVIVDYQNFESSRRRFVHGRHRMDSLNKHTSAYLDAPVSGLAVFCRTIEL
jgi:hypothetical protein